jgi:uncharacterized protein YjbI with pentapeptide repeats
MQSLFVEDQHFVNIDFAVDGFLYAEYEQCKFTGCNFAGTKPDDLIFLECEFENCNFSMVLFNNTALRDVQFTQCKLTGADFSSVNHFLFGVKFTGCNLNYISFYKLKLKETVFTKCQIEEADFTEADLNKSVFNDCNLVGSIFFMTNLQSADFRGAVNYTFDPEQNQIKKAKFANPAVLGLLAKYQISID